MEDFLTNETSTPVSSGLFPLIHRSQPTDESEEVRAVVAYIHNFYLLCRPIVESSA